MVGFGFGFGCAMDSITVSHGITVSPPESYGLRSTDVCIIIYPVVLQDNSSKLMEIICQVSDQQGTWAIYVCDPHEHGSRYDPSMTYQQPWWNVEEPIPQFSKKHPPPKKCYRNANQTKWS